ncbi:hypothetical protein VTN77DRAFT_337 [Rasamsonia byssochlamydoides]|uniref:uncharacterized protein n=1 Tax=Rasamsonia byssochlamydoides TaxID=89139 RepID=UPI00374235C0
MSDNIDGNVDIVDKNVENNVVNNGEDNVKNDVENNVKKNVENNEKNENDDDDSSSVSDLSGDNESEYWDDAEFYEENEERNNQGVAGVQQPVNNNPDDNTAAQSAPATSGAQVNIPAEFLVGDGNQIATRSFDKLFEGDGNLSFSEQQAFADRANHLSVDDFRVQPNQFDDVLGTLNFDGNQFDPHYNQHEFDDEIASNATGHAQADNANTPSSNGTGIQSDVPPPQTEEPLITEPDFQRLMDFLRTGGTIDDIITNISAASVGPVADPQANPLPTPSVASQPNVNHNVSNMPASVNSIAGHTGQVQTAGGEHTAGEVSDEEDASEEDLGEEDSGEENAVEQNAVEENAEGAKKETLPPPPPPPIPRAAHLLDPVTHDMDMNTRFSSYEEACAYRPYAFKTPPHDPTIPTRTEQNRAIVMALKKSMMEMGYAQDNKLAQERYEGLIEPTLVEVACWKMLDLLIKRAKYGPLVPSKENMKLDKKAGRVETFQERLDNVLGALYRRKTICKGVLDPHRSENLVDHPAREERRSEANRRLNLKKGKYVQVGKQVLMANGVDEDGNPRYVVVNEDGEIELDSTAAASSLTTTADVDGGNLPPTATSTAPSQPAVSSTLPTGAAKSSSSSRPAGRKPKTSARQKKASTTRASKSKAASADQVQTANQPHLPSAHASLGHHGGQSLLGQQPEFTSATQQPYGTAASPAQNQRRRVNPILASNPFLPRAIQEQLDQPYVDSQTNGYVPLPTQHQSQNYTMTGALSQNMQRQACPIPDEVTYPEYNPAPAQMQQNYSMPDAVDYPMYDPSLAQPMQQGYSVPGAVSRQHMNAPAPPQNRRMSGQATHQQGNQFPAQMNLNQNHMAGPVARQQPHPSVQNRRISGQIAHSQSNQFPAQVNQNQKLMAGAIYHQQSNPLVQNHRISGQATHPQGNQFPAQVNLNQNLMTGAVAHQQMNPSVPQNQIRRMSGQATRPKFNPFPAQVNQMQNPIAAAVARQQMNPSVPQNQIRRMSGQATHPQVNQFPAQVNLNQNPMAGPAPHPQPASRSGNGTRRKRSQADIGATDDGTMLPPPPKRAHH